MPIFNFNQNGQVMIPLPMPIENGGTGAENAATARANLGLGTAALLNFTLPLSVANGGTGNSANLLSTTNIDTALTVDGNGFFDCWEGGTYPTGATHLYGFQVRHRNLSGVWGLQAGAQHHLPELFFRTISDGLWKPWAKVWNSNHGTPVWQAPSDRKLKNSVKPIENALKLILNSNPVRFRYTAKIRERGLFGDLRDRCKPHYGFIAQDFPIDELVTEKDDGEKGINYLEIIPFLVKAIQELQEQIDVLKKVTN